MSEALIFSPALEKPELISSSILTLLKEWPDSTSALEVLVAEIDPASAGSQDFCNRYGVNPAEGANCVIVEAKRGDHTTLAACLAPADCRMDFNGAIRRALNARRVSLAPLETVLKETKMEYGSITAIGLPFDWPVLIDSRLVDLPRIVMGAGLVKAKLSVPGKMLMELPGAVILENLGTPVAK